MGRVTSADLKGLVFPLSVQVEELGSTFVDSKGREFRYVKYNDGDGNLPGVRGQICYNVVVNAANISIQYQVTCDLGSSTVVSDDDFAGIIVPDVVLNGEYCWVQVHGVGLVRAWAEAAIDRDGTNELTKRLRPSSTDGIVASLADGTGGQPEQWFALLLADVDGTPTAVADRFLATIPAGQTTTAQFAVGETVTANAKTGVVVEVLRRGTTDYAIIASTLSAAWAAAETGVGGTSAASGVLSAIGYAVFPQNYRIVGTMR